MRSIQPGRTYRALITLVTGVIFWTLCLTNTGTAQSVGTIGAGTTIKVRTTEPIKTGTDGKMFSAVVDQNVIGKNGKVVIPKGSNAELVVRRISDNNVALDLDSVTVNGQRYGVQTENNVVRSEEKQGVGVNKRTGKYVGGGAAIGAIVGAIAGGGKGAAIGAGVGAGAGAGAQILTKGKSVNVPAESLLTYRLKQPLRAGAAAR
ncbi:MAG TPA: hypothetical protein VE422_24855 [Terriglobia bacterium]|nr:hypothetical protein [Terriglobia bacterium]